LPFRRRIPSPLAAAPESAASVVSPSAAGSELDAEEEPPHAIRPAAIAVASATAKIFFFIVSSLLK
jgi:hypothetical protein